MKWKDKYLLRSILSFSVLILFMVIVVKGFHHVQKGKQISGAPAPLYKGYVLNEEVWKLLRSNKRSTRIKNNNLAGKSPRINGDIGLLSEVDLDRYSVKVETPGKNLSLPLGAFKLLPKSQVTTEFRCIEGWAEDVAYAGAKFTDFMRVYDIGKKSDGTYYSYVGLETPDGEYYVSIDMESMMHEQTVLTYEMNERPLSLENGAPIRLIIPVKYGIKSLKRIGKIIFSDQKPPDYWAERGYDWYSGL
ncbi:MAG: molybdopterin-dependent oxidoreductase [Bacteriovoracaceae bacterium]